MLHVKSKHSPLMRVIETLLPQNAKEDLLRTVPRNCYLYFLGTYSRMIPKNRSRDKFCVWDVIDSDVYDEVRRGSADLLLDMSLETFPIPSNQWQTELDEIYVAIRSLAINPDRVIVVSSNLHSKKAIADHALARGVVPLRVLAADICFAYYWIDLCRDKEAVHREPNSTVKHNFLFLNRKIKVHRIALLLALLASNGRKNALYSLIGDGRPDETGFLGVVGERAKRLLIRLGVTHGVDDALEHLMREFPKSLSGPPPKTARETANSMEPTTLYDDTMMSLVGETSFSNGTSCFITEKTFKPMMMEQPFLLVGDAGSLRRLHRLGFKTFGRVVNERYDDVADPAKRMHALIIELQRLSEFDAQQRYDLRASLREEVRHNLTHLYRGFPETFAATLKESFAATWSTA